MAFSSSLPAVQFTDELKREHPSIFLYALAGVGKTNALGTLKPLNPLVLATEEGQTKGMSTLAHLHFAVLLVHNLTELELILAHLKQGAKSGALTYNGTGPFGCLCCDSYTGIGTMLERKSIEMKGWGADGIWGGVTAGSHKDPRTAYPYIAEKGREVFRSLMDLPVPLVVTAREQMYTEGEGKNAKTYPVPELPGQKLPKELPGWPEASVRLRMVNGKRVMVTENEGDAIARVRLGEGMRLNKYVKPDLYALIRALRGDAEAVKELNQPTT